MSLAFSSHLSPGCLSLSSSEMAIMLLASPTEGLGSFRGSNGFLQLEMLAFNYRDTCCRFHRGGFSAVAQLLLSVSRDAQRPPFFFPSRPVLSHMLPGT